MIYKKIDIKDLDNTIEIFKHEQLKYADGTYPEKEWITSFINNGLAYGVYENNQIKAALVAETLLMDGVSLWLIATRKEDIGKGYGQFLYEEFEKEMKKLGKKWIFLTSPNASEKFYFKNGFETNGKILKEFVKEL